MSNQHPSPARLEAFSDGVIAVIITTMVLELKLPPRHSGLVGLYTVIPALAVYLLSFTLTGIYCLSGQLGLSDIATQRKHLLSLCIYLITIPLAFSHPRAALTAIAAVTLLWIVPSFGLKPSSVPNEPSRSIRIEIAPPVHRP